MTTQAQRRPVRPARQWGQGLSIAAVLTLVAAYAALVASFFYLGPVADGVFDNAQTPQQQADTEAAIVPFWSLQAVAFVLWVASMGMALVALARLDLRRQRRLPAWTLGIGVLALPAVLLVLFLFASLL
ncbi:hypothetical protein [Rhodococcus sp. X156]|uniref:hypothetical protein n=1 Tax=Rhodococcus sp. X156 TaxID=2499145 RepID=UPI000FDA53B5|nr:hypothetical protein [Rhodococcus sp. X156]